MNARAYKTARIAAIAYADIGRPSGWPKASSEKCCVFDAINLVGNAMYGDAWTGHELCAMIWPESPQAAEIQRQKFAPQAISTSSTAPVPRPRVPQSIAAAQYVRTAPTPVLAVPHDAHVKSMELHFAVKLHSVAVIEEQKLWEANNEELKRLIGAVDWLAQRSRDDELPSFARQTTGGPLFKLDCSEWNIEYPIHYFVSNGGPIRMFVELCLFRPVASFIFFNRLDVDRVIATLEHAPVIISMADLTELSPYIRLAVSLAKSYGLSSPDKTKSQKQRNQLVRTAWADAMPGITISNAQVNALVLVMGWPNQKAIERGMRGPQQRKNTPL